MFSNSTKSDISVSLDLARGTLFKSHNIISRTHTHAHTHTHRNGALDLAPIVKKQRQIAGTKKKDTSDAKVTKPKELAAFEDEEESTTKDVAHIFKHLKMACSQSSDRVHYFSFLIDPDSFSHTVENFFHFAFLVKVRL